MLHSVYQARFRVHGSQTLRGRQDGRGQLGLFPSILRQTVAATFILTMLTSPAFAGQGQKKGSVGGDALDAATQPLNDFNIRSKDIPEVLVRAQAEPYTVIGLSECGSLRGEIGLLEDVLGPDADAASQKTGLVNKALKTGGNMLSGFIPFRSVVRQLSGANAASARMESAIYSGVARRSFLKGVAFAKDCQSSEAMTIQSAEDILQLGTAPER